MDRKGEVEASFSKEQFRGGNVRNVMIAQERGSLEECNESAKRGGHNLFFWLGTAQVKDWRLF